MSDLASLVTEVEELIKNAPVPFKWLVRSCLEDEEKPGKYFANIVDSDIAYPHTGWGNTPELALTNSINSFKISLEGWSDAST